LHRPAKADSDTFSITTDTNSSLSIYLIIYLRRLVGDRLLRGGNVTAVPVRSRPCHAFPVLPGPHMSMNRTRTSSTARTGTASAARDRPCIGMFLTVKCGWILLQHMLGVRNTSSYRRHAMTSLRKANGSMPCGYRDHSSSGVLTSFRGADTDVNIGRAGTQPCTPYTTLNTILI
jgi:hypothetical protein